MIDDAVMIDLAEMKSADVDPEARTVVADGGLTWRELNEATAAHGLAVTGGAISTTGVAGLTLGGGLGWLMGLYGLAADNLLEAELVDAERRGAPGVATPPIPTSCGRCAAAAATSASSRASRSACTR